LELIFISDHRVRGARELPVLFYVLFLGWIEQIAEMEYETDNLIHPAGPNKQVLCDMSRT
jgi:hypothetical protein